MIKVAINGFGRIGRMFFRFGFGREEIEIVAINDLGDLNNLIYLLKNDSVYRKWNKDIEVGDNSFSLDCKKVLFFQEKDPTQLPWKDLSIDVVVESTGFFTTSEKAKAHLLAGAKRVVISAPLKDDDQKGFSQTVLLGVNEEEFKNCQISSNGSCTTNSAYPVIQILNETIGIGKAMLTTIHSYTSRQKLIDAPDSSNWRLGRAAADNIIPSTTGAAISVTRAIKELKGLFDGISIRVPSLVGSISDITFLAKRNTTVEEIKNILQNAEKTSRWQGIFKTSSEELVSSDIIGETYVSIVDLKFIKVVDGNLVKILAWYDNEVGYTHSLINHVIKAGNS